MEFSPLVRQAASTGRPPRRAVGGPFPRRPGDEYAGERVQALALAYHSRTTCAARAARQSDTSEDSNPKLTRGSHNRNARVTTTHAAVRSRVTLSRPRHRTPSREGPMRIIPPSPAARASAPSAAPFASMIDTSPSSRAIVATGWTAENQTIGARAKSRGPDLVRHTPPPGATAASWPSEPEPTVQPRTPPTVALTFRIGDSLHHQYHHRNIAIEPFARMTVAENGQMWTGARVASETP